MRNVWRVGIGLFLLLFAWLATLLAVGAISSSDNLLMWFLVGVGVAWALGGLRCKPISRWAMALLCTAIAAFAFSVLSFPL